MPIADLKSVEMAAASKPGTRESLLSAAEELFAARGYAAVGVREIVERAGANIAAINYHFGSKSALYLETVRSSMQRGNGGAVWDVLSSAPQDREAAILALARFVHMFLTHITQTTGSTCACNLLVHEAAEPSEAVDAVVRDFIRPHQQALIALIERINPAVTPAERLLHAEGIIGQILHYRVFRPFIERLGVCDLADPSEVDRTAEHIVRSCLRALRCEESLIDRAATPTAPALSETGST